MYKFQAPAGSNQSVFQYAPVDRCLREDSETIVSSRTYLVRATFDYCVCE